jgi:hypothetical protein
MANVLSEDKKQQVIALGRLGWSLRRIERETSIRRETAGEYLRAAGVAVRPAGWTGKPTAKPAIEVTTDSGPGKAFISVTAGADAAKPFSPALASSSPSLPHDERLANHTGGLCCIRTRRGTAHP